jgi:hypothetical protein
MKKYLEPKYWYILWAIISSSFIPLAIVMVIISATTNTNVGFVFLMLEFLSPILFGVYLANKEKFKINLIKFLFLFTVLIVTILLLGKTAMAIAPVLILFIMPLIKISTTEAKWAFGSMMLYIFSGIPGFAILVYFHLELYGLALLYISKGAIFGKIMQIIYEKKVNR